MEGSTCLLEDIVGSTSNIASVSSFSGDSCIVLHVEMYLVARRCSKLLCWTGVSPFSPNDAMFMEAASSIVLQACQVLSNCYGLLIPAKHEVSAVFLGCLSPTHSKRPSQMLTSGLRLPRTGRVPWSFNIILRVT